MNSVFNELDGFENFPQVRAIFELKRVSIYRR